MSILSRSRGSAALIAVLLTAACNLDVAPPTRNDGELRTPSISARLDTVAWSDAAGVAPTEAASPAPGTYSIVADGRISDGRAVRLTLSMSNIRGAGTYPIGVGPSVAGATATVVTSSGGAWAAPYSGIAGTLVLTEVTATRMRGTFTMSLAPQSALAGTPINVTGGQFDLPVTGAGAGGVLPDNAGSKVSATLGGTAFNAALVTSNGFSDGLQIRGTTDTREILIDLQDISAPGTYRLGEDTPGRFISVTTSAVPAQQWTSTGAGSSGSVTVTSVTASRVVGTFAATLSPATGATGTLSATNGSFDIGR